MAKELETRSAIPFMDREVYMYKIINFPRLTEGLEQVTKATYGTFNVVICPRLYTVNDGRQEVHLAEIGLTYHGHLNVRKGHRILSVRFRYV